MSNEKAPEYSGFKDPELIQIITMYGSRQECSYTELTKMRGALNLTALSTQLTRLVQEGDLTRSDRAGEAYYRATKKPRVSPGLFL